MYKWLSVLVFSFVLHSSKAQVALRGGFSAGPTFILMENDQKLSNGFFTSTRAGANAGLNLSMQAGEHFWSRVGVNYNRLNFSLKQNTSNDYRIDFRYGLNNLEIPLQLGVTGYLGSLKHREYLGVAFVNRLGRDIKTTITGDSSAVYAYATPESVVRTSYLAFVAGLEVGTEFKNDAGLFFGLSMRYNPETQYSSSFNTTVYGNQLASTKGNYLMLEVTYYLPRFSYWFKRDFTFCLSKFRGELPLLLRRFRLHCLSQFPFLPSDLFLPQLYLGCYKQ
jgi:hypothetical protein